MVDVPGAGGSAQVGLLQGKVRLKLWPPLEIGTLATDGSVEISTVNRFVINHHMLLEMD